MCKEIKIIVFDLDGVLVKYRSSWGYLHEQIGSHKIVNERDDAEAFKKGEISYEEWMKRDISAMLRAREKITREDIVKIFASSELDEHAEEIVQFIKDLGIKTAIVSGGIDILANIVAEKLGIEIVYANKLKFDENGYLIPEGVKVVDPLRKDKVLIKISKTLNIPLNNFMYIGDSDWDKSAFKVVGYPVLYLRDNELPRLELNLYTIKSLKELKEIINRLC
jgi:phosphoserine phosphatase